MYSPELNQPIRKETNDGGYPFRSYMAEKIIRLLDTATNIKSFEREKAEEIFADEKSRREFILNLSSEDYKNLLIGINGILRNKERSEWEMDGKDVAIKDGHGDVAWDFPEFEDKQYLIDLSLQSAKKMISNGNDIENIAILLSSVITAVHPFNDGNGRTAKFVLALINKGYSKDKKNIIENVLTSSDFSNSVNSGLMESYIREIIEREIGIRIKDIRFRFRDGNGHFPYDVVEKGVMNFSHVVSPEKQELFKEKLKRSWFYMFDAIFMYFKNNIDKYRNANDNQNLRLDLVIRDLTNEAIDEIINTWKQLKKKDVELIIDCIVNPDKEEYQFETKRYDTVTKESILNLYKLKIKRGTDDAIHSQIFG